MQNLRAAIRAAAPGAAESFGYGMPAFKARREGPRLVRGVEEAQQSLPNQPGHGTQLAAALKGYATSGKGTVQFPIDEPVPVTLVRRLVAARIAEMRRTAPRTTRKTAGTKKGRPS